MEKKNQIDQYLLNKLDLEEKRKFQEELETNPELMKEVKKRATIISGIEALGNEKMAERIKIVRQEMIEEEAKSITSQKKTKGKIIKLILSVAAASALFFFCWQFIANQKNTPEQLFAQTYEPYTASISTRDATAEESLTQANEYYNAEKYKDAIPLLKTALSNQPKNSNLELALGNAYLSSHQIDLAISHFQNIIQRPSKIFGIF